MVRFHVANDHARVRRMRAWASTLGDGGAVLLDFDGPVCSVFAGYPASRVAENLRVALTTRGIDVTDGLAAISDHSRFSVGHPITILSGPRKSTLFLTNTKNKLFSAQVPRHTRVKP